MMRLVLAALLFSFATVPADAQFRRAPKFAEKGDLALVVELAGLDVFRLQPALSGVGVRYRVADQTVVGGSLGLGVVDATSDSDFSGGDSNEQTSTDFRLATWVEQHVGVRSRYVSPFVGAGVQFGVFDQLSVSTQEVDLGDGETTVFRRETSSQGYVVGGGVLLGAEVRLARGITVGGAYTLGIEYQSSDDRFEDNSRPGGAPTVQSRDVSVLRAGTGVTDLVFSVYF